MPSLIAQSITAARLLPRFLAALIVGAVLSGPALSHEGVTGPTKVRMDLMKEIGKATKALGAMAKSGGFDAVETARLADVIARHGVRIDEVFTEPHMHPKTEALPVIWDEWPKFSAQGRDMVDVAKALSAATDRDGFLSAMKDLGANCKACHRDFRKE